MFIVLTKGIIKSVYDILLILKEEKKPFNTKFPHCKFL